MTLRIAQDWNVPGRRRAGAFLLAICLNLALVPCTMALEVVEQGHDCCPPEIQLEAAECCELDDVNVDLRGGALEPVDLPDLEVLPSPVLDHGLVPAHRRYVAAAQPPDPPDNFPPLYHLHCAYLK